MERLFTSVRQFCKSDSAKTTKAYRGAMVQFGISKYGEGLSEEEVFTNLDKYIRTANRQEVLDDLRYFKDYLDSQTITKVIDGNEITVPYALRTRMLRIAVVQSWLIKNEMGLPKAYNSEFTYKEKPEPDDLAFTQETALAVYHQLKSSIAKCLFIVLLVTGCRISEVVSIKLSWVTWDYKLQDGTRGPVSIRLPGSITKNGRARTVFLTREAENLLKELWTKKETRRVSRKGPERRRQEIWMTGRDLYIHSTMGKRGMNFPNAGKGKSNQKTGLGDDRLFPISVSTIADVLSEAIRRAGYVEKTGTGMNKLHVHSTRKFFRTQFGQAAGPDAAETIMGHTPGLTANYRLMEESQVATLFLKHERALKLFRDAETDLVKDRVDRQADQILALERENANIRAELNASNQETREFIELMKKRELERQAASPPLIVSDAGIMQSET